MAPMLSPAFTALIACTWAQLRPCPPECESCLTSENCSECFSSTGGCEMCDFFIDNCFECTIIAEPATETPTRTTTGETIGAEVPSLDIGGEETPGLCSRCYDRFTYNPVSELCEPCEDPNCSDCSTTPCSQCDLGFEVPEGSDLCMPIECPDGTFLNTCGECQDCYDPRCKSCTLTECDECLSGFVKNSLGVCMCEPGLFLNQEGECETCSDPYCSKCSSSECFSCSSGFFLKKGKCIKGTEIMDSYCSFLIKTNCECWKGKLYGDQKCADSVSFCEDYYNDGKCFHCEDNQLGRGECY